MAKNLAVSQIADRPLEIFGLRPANLAEMYEVCERIASTDLVPKDMRGKPNNVLVAVQMGLEIGLAPMQALQNIAVINGRPSLWGDAIPAVAQATGELEDWQEWYDEATQTAYCLIKRRGLSEHEKTFSIEDAKAAGLLGKEGPWKQYPKRMCQMRARAFAFRDRFADALKGVHVAEEVRDYVDMGEADVVSRTPPEPPRRKSETQQQADEPEKGSPAPEAKAEKPKGGGKKKAKAAEPEPTPEPTQDESAGQPSADNLIEQIALAESRESVLNLVGNTAHLSEADKERVTDCGRSRWKELQAETESGSEPRAQQDSLGLPGNYGDE